MADVTPRLLYVDANHGRTDMVLQQIKKICKGCPITTAGNGNEAMRLLSREKFDLILMDCWIPEVSGFKICRLIRQTDEKVPVIMLSDLELMNDRKFAEVAGATAYFLKDRDVKQLLDFVSESINSISKSSVVH
jgi:DNA-binding response OmpR family regulator